MLAKNSLVRRDRPESIDIVKVRLVKERSSPYGKQTVKRSEDTLSVAKKFLAGEDREVLISINLDQSLKICSIHVVAIGSVSTTVVHPREIFKAAILSNASHLVLAHNHSSGDPNPSDDDEELTCKLFAWGDMLAIPVEDHIIIGDDKYSRCNKIKGNNGKIQIWWETRNFESDQEVS